MKKTPLIFAVLLVLVIWTVAAQTNGVGAGEQSASGTQQLVLLDPVQRRADFALVEAELLPAGAVPFENPDATVSGSMIGLHGMYAAADPVDPVCRGKNPKRDGFQQGLRIDLEGRRCRSHPSPEQCSGQCR